MVRKNTAEAKAEASKRDEVKARIVAEALEAVENALLSDRITTLDTMLFGTMKLALSTAGPISFHPIDWTNTSPDMRKLITTRVTAPRPKGEASHFLGRYRRYDGFTLASMGRNAESRRL
mgnify:CR=1 FL=1